MRKIIESKTGKLIISLLITIILFNYIIPSYSQANTDHWAGKLIEPLADVVCSIGDGLMNLMQGTMMPGSPKAVTRRSAWDQIKMEDGKVTVGENGAEFAADIFMKDGFWDALSDFVRSGALTIASGGLLGGLSVLNWAGVFTGGTEVGQQISDVFKEQAYPMIFYGPGAIFSNRVPALDVNFLRPGRNFEKQYDFLLMWTEEEIGQDGKKDDYIKEMQASYGLTEGEAEESYELYSAVKGAKDNNIPKEEILSSSRGGESNKLANTAFVIKPIISRWYIALRNIAIVGLMIVLLYIGIRILISSASEEKAKYKTMIKDWVVAFILVFFIHYIMLAMLTITDSITDMLGENIFGQSVSKQIEELQQTGAKKGMVTLVKGDIILNSIRAEESLARGDTKGETGWLDTFGYAIMYLALVFYTIIFTFRFLKRVVYMAFLTIIAPMVALTYPIDKINDKRAQAFGYWFKEYMFNLLIGPIDLLLYIVLVSSAIELATTNILYAIVAIGFILEAEDFIRTMFGVKAEGGAFGSSFAAGALFSSGLHMLDRIASGTKGLIKGSDNDKKENEDDGNEEINDPNARISMNAFNSDNNGELPEEGDPDFIGPPRPPEELENEEENPEDTLPPGYEDVDPDDPMLAYLQREGLLDEDEPGDGEENPELEDNTPADFIAEDPAESTYDDELDNSTPLILPSNQQNSEQPSRYSRVINGYKKVAGRYFNTKKGKKLLKEIIKKGTEIGGASILGSVGLAIGLASKEGVAGVAKYTAAGMASGGGLAKVGNNLVTSGLNTAKRVAQNAGEDFEAGYYTPEERRQRRNEQLIKEFYNDKDNIRYYKDKWGEKNYKKKMDQAVEMKKYGINKPDQINKALKLRDKMPELTAQQTATAVKMAENTSEAKLRNLKDRKQITDSAAAVIPNKTDRSKFMTALDLYHGIDESDSKAYNKEIEKMTKEEARKEQRRIEQAQQQQEEKDVKTESPNENYEEQINQEHNRRRDTNKENREREEMYQKGKNEEKESFIDPRKMAEEERNNKNNDD